MTTPPLVEVHDDADALATAVAGELLVRLEDAQSSGRDPHLGLTGGGLSRRVHREVARLGADSDVDWSRVVVWWGDERFVAPDDEERNSRQAREDLLDVLPFDPAKVHEVPSTADADSLATAATSYASLLDAHGPPALEVLMLGVGPDGHVASLFPGHPALDVADRSAVAVPDSPKPPPERVTLTLPVLNRARTVWFLVSGDAKAEAVARGLAPGAAVHDVPAAGVAGQVETTWFLDRAAASQL